MNKCRILYSDKRGNYWYHYIESCSKTFFETHINCGTNEELFLAIAALRDDSDEEQWFNNNKKWRKLSKNIPWPQDSFTLECHKATIKELINHFQ